MTGDGLPVIAGRDARHRVEEFAAAEGLGQRFVDEVYNMAVAWLSEWTHTGNGSFDINQDGHGNAVITERKASNDDWPSRAFAVSTYAFLLEQVSRWCGLNIETECETIRTTVTLDWSAIPQSPYHFRTT